MFTIKLMFDMVGLLNRSTAPDNSTHDPRKPLAVYLTFRRGTHGEHPTSNRETEMKTRSLALKAVLAIAIATCVYQAFAVPTPYEKNRCRQMEHFCQ